MDLEAIVKKGAFYWEDRANEVYFDPMEELMESQWDQLIFPILKKMELKLEHVVDLGAGKGRNCEFLLKVFDRVTAVDVSQENVNACRKRFARRNVNVIKSDGYSLKEFQDDSVDLIYSFDSFVHFDLEIVMSYIKEFHRVLSPGSYGFIHHSNLSEFPGVDFKKNVHWRNFMSKELFCHLCLKNNFNVISQQTLDWGEVKELDCITVIRK
jgi:cyclopropane fatty-acyl-phospholipid synthase-like methyltransferase